MDEVLMALNISKYFCDYGDRFPVTLQLVHLIQCQALKSARFPKKNQKNTFHSPRAKNSVMYLYQSFLQCMLQRICSFSMKKDRKHSKICQIVLNTCETEKKFKKILRHDGAKFRKNQSFCSSCECTSLRATLSTVDICVVRFFAFCCH